MGPILQEEEKMYFDRNEKLGFFEELIFDHKYDEDTGLIKRDGVNTYFVHLACLAAILGLVIIGKIF